MSTKPGVPRPSVRKASEPPPVVQARPPMPSAVELLDEDLVIEAEPVAVARPRSTPPPPPRHVQRSGIVPTLQGVSVPKIAPLAAPPNIELPMPASLVAPTAAAARKSVPHMLKLITPSISIVPEPPRAAPVTVAPPPPVAVAPAVPVPAPIIEAAPLSRIAVRRSRPESMLDPTEVLFEIMYALEHVESQWQAAAVCAEALARALGARSVVVHAHDLVGRELRVIGTHGEHAVEILGSSGPSDDDLVGSAVICNEKPVTMRFDGELPRLAPRRLALLGAPRTLVAVPAMAWGRCVAMIEIVDADERFASRVADAASYVAERLAAYLSGRLAA